MKIMKKLILILLTFISLNIFGQIKVKEDSFKEIEGYVMLDKYEHTDINDKPMALIKISTENINAEQRKKFIFKGNLATSFDVHFEPGEIYLYISAAAATFIEIIHDDFGKTEFTIPYDLCDYCGYEMVLQYNPLTPVNEARPQNNFVTIIADQPNATIYIDDEYIGDKEAAKSLPIGSTHTWKIECDLFHTESGTMTIKDDTIIEKTLRPAFGYLMVESSPVDGAVVFVNNKRVGETPYMSDKIASGTYNVRVMKEMYKTTEKTFTVTDSNTTTALLNMAANFVNVTISTDADSDIYIDEQYKGKGIWNGNLSDGSHFIEVRKDKHKSIKRNINLVLGKNETITIEAPKPIYGFLEISSDPLRTDIYIDGELYGQTPKVIDNLLIGTHELKLEKQGYSTLTKNINITEGETLVLNETLENEMESNTINGHEYVDLGLGVKWATCNVGANKPEEYGDYFAWGEIKPKTEYTQENNKIDVTHIIHIKGKPEYDPAQANWGGNWRLPSRHDMYNLKYNCKWTWETNNGTNGYRVTGPNGNSIFLPAAGYKNKSTHYDIETNGFYWAYDFEYCDSIEPLYMSLREDFISSWPRNAHYGHSIRPVTDGKSYWVEPKDVKKRTFTVKGVSFDMIEVEGGKFLMGAQSENANDDNYDIFAVDEQEPVHSETLSDFLIGETEVTQELWEAVMGKNIYQQKDKQQQKDYFQSVTGVGNNHPIYFVSWDDCQKFIKKLNKLTGKNFRLPTEAEWEYAARGGDKSRKHRYSGSNRLDDVGYYIENSGDIKYDLYDLKLTCGEIDYDKLIDSSLIANNNSTHMVKSLLPNELGIYDMSGNVSELCQNISDLVHAIVGYESELYYYRIIRGGSWAASKEYCRVSCRHTFVCNEGADFVGFRLAMDSEN